MCPVSKWLHVAIFCLYLIIHGAEREREAEKTENEGVTCWIQIKAVLWEHWNCFGRLSHRDTSSKAMRHTKILTAATLRGLISLHNVSERKGMMFVFWSVVRAKIIMSQRTGGKIKRPFVSSQWSSWLELATVTLRPCWSWCRQMWKKKSVFWNHLNSIFLKLPSNIANLLLLCGQQKMVAL